MKKSFLIILFSLIGVIAFSQHNFDAKSLLTKPQGQQKLVNDFTGGKDSSGTLTPDQQSALESKLVELDNSTSTQVAVVIIPSLSGYDVSDYGVQLLRAWGIGDKKSNNGVLLLICTDPTNHKVNITTGYGVEGALPDITSKEIIDNEIIPNFKNKDYYGGINKGVDAIIKAVRGEYNAPRNVNNHRRIPFRGFFFIIIIIIFIIRLISRGGGGSSIGGGGSSGLGSSLFWLSMLSGGFGGRGSGGGGGGFGGGGFGGFGGGSSGGGGASGSW